MTGERELCNGLGRWKVQMLVTSVTAAYSHSRSKFVQKTSKLSNSLIFMSKQQQTAEKTSVN